VTSVLVTGASGYLGKKFVQALARDLDAFPTIVATDVRAPRDEDRVEGVHYETFDVRKPGLSELLEAHAIDAVVHLATIVTPGRDTPRSLQYDVDVRGTELVLEACLRAKVRQLVVTSSGAAYGYYADNDALLTEASPLRGNEAFAYAHHKRIVEEMLARASVEHPELRQLVLRPGTILGIGAKNQITDLFTGRFVLGLEESETPFVFVLDEDVVRVLVQGVRDEWTGVYNLAGEGVLTLREIASRMGKPFVALPERVIRGGIAALQRVGATQYGPEQTAFLMYRPVLSAEKLRRERGVALTPSRDVFERWRKSLWRGTGASAPWQARSVVVTGGASGIGLATARRFAELGASIALFDKDAEAAEVQAELLSRDGARVIAVACDVTDPAACERAIAEVRRVFGGVDVLVNNAGIAHRSLFEDTAPEVLRRVMEVNFFGAVNCTRAAMASLVERKGTIVAVSSVAGFAPLVGRTGYAASKHALHGFFDSLRSELQRCGVRVVLVCPSFTDTGIDAAALSGNGGHAGMGKPIAGALASPEQIADALVSGVLDGAREVLPTRLSRQARWLSWLGPTLYERAMLSAQGREFGLK